MGSENNNDLISNLPDDILCHILSFLETKYSVRTSVLSTRWKRLYTFVPILNFEYHNNSLFGTSNSQAADFKSFLNFVHAVLFSYKVSRMEKLRLKYTDGIYRPEHFPFFLLTSNAVQRNVHEVDITYFGACFFQMPQNLFSCKTLTILTIKGSFNVGLPSSVSLPCLRICSFQGLFFDSESGKFLFRSCPALEYLELNRCCFRDSFLDISTPTLKGLTIQESNYYLKYQLVLNVPDLLSFEYNGTALNISGLESLISVVDANIFYRKSNTGDSSVVDLICSLCHVQQFDLNHQVMEAFLRTGGSLPIFNSLRRLTLSISFCSLRLLPGFLENSPQLEFLSINQAYPQNSCEVDESRHSYLFPEHVPVCVSVHLKEAAMSLDGFVYYERKLIKYFLKYAKNLKKMKIQSKLTWDEQLETSSASCQIVLEQY